MKKFNKEKKENSQVIDLTKEECPINLVKFKFHFYNLEHFTCIVKKGDQLEGIINFLKYKEVDYQLKEESNYCKIIL